MLELAEVPLFAGLPDSSLRWLRRAGELRCYASGGVIIRKGDLGRFICVVVHGGVSVHVSGRAGSGPPEVVLGPGEVFGEMSLLVGSPISATVVAAQDTAIYFLPKPAFVKLLEHPTFRGTLLRLIVRRMHDRAGPSPRPRHRPCALLVMSSPWNDVGRLFVSALTAAVSYYVPGARVVECSSGRPRGTARSGEPWTQLESLPRDGLREHAVGVPASRLPDLVRGWRRSVGAPGLLMLVLRSAEARELRHVLERGDVVLLEEDPQVKGHLEVLSTGIGLADLHLFRLPRKETVARFQEEGSWPFRLAVRDLDSFSSEGDRAPWLPSRCATVDRIARWVTQREIGIALGPGAAAGFCHLGVLQVLEEAAIAPDYLVGSSIGGAAALLYARHGDARSAAEAARDVVGRTERIVDVRWLPRSSLLAGRKHSAAASALFGADQFAELTRPTAAVAADLVYGERVVMEQGSVATAARATTAIPGVFPPVSSRGRLLVDGALVSQIPLDLLHRRRCGLKLAVTTTPLSQDFGRKRRWLERELTHRFERPFGFRSVIASSWHVLTSRHAALEVESADVVLEPRVPQPLSFDFDSCDEMLEAGRRAAEEKLELIRSAVASLRTPAP